MRFKTKSRWLNVTISGVLLFVLVAAIFALNKQPGEVREFSSIRDEWERVVFGFAREGRLAPGELPPEPTLPLRGKERAEADQRLADQCVQLADKHPDTWGALAALYLAASRAPDLDAGKQALRRLTHRMSAVDLGSSENAGLASRPSTN